MHQRPRPKTQQTAHDQEARTFFADFTDFVDINDFVTFVVSAKLFAVLIILLASVGPPDKRVGSLDPFAPVPPLVGGVVAL